MFLLLELFEVSFADLLQGRQHLKVDHQRVRCCRGIASNRGVGSGGAVGALHPQKLKWGCMHPQKSKWRCLHPQFLK